MSKILSHYLLNYNILSFRKGLPVAKKICALTIVTFGSLLFEAIAVIHLLIN